MNTEHEKEEWISTDEDTNQYMKQISETIFVFKEDRVIDPSTFEVEGYQLEIDLSDYTEEEMISDCAQFGYEKEEVLQWLYDRTNLDLIAECIFEMSNE